MLTTIIAYVNAHPFGCAVGAYWFFCAAVQSMPEPRPTDSRWYLWINGLLHTIAGNLQNAYGAKIPGIQTSKENQ